MTFDEAFTKLLDHEGGYSNHPDDPGGETMWGVTLRVARANGYLGEMKNFTQEQAKNIYRKLYWNPCKADELPPEIRFDIFDGAVNSGVSQSVKWLQRAAGAVDDGVIGPGTIGACKKISGEKLRCKYNGHRLLFMTGLKPWDSFGNGWARRIASNLLD